MCASCLQHTSRGLGAHLEAVLLGHDPLSFPLVAGLPSCSNALRGQVSTCRSPLPLRQVKIHHLEANLVANKVLQLKYRNNFFKKRIRELEFTEGARVFPV